MYSLTSKNIARALDVAPPLLPHVPELLSDIWVLGSWPGVIVDMLSSLNLDPSTTHVLDLGSGKGAVAIAIAERLGCHVLGVDLFRPFVEDSQGRAESSGVGELCTFQLADFRDTLCASADFDVVTFAGVGGALGTFDRCVGELRRTIKSRGYMVIDDGFLAHRERGMWAAFEHYASLNETRRRLTAHGDRIIQEEIISLERLREYNKRTATFIRRRAEKLGVRYPSLRALLRDFVEKDAEESRLLESEVVPAVWLLQKGDGS